MQGWLERALRLSPMRGGLVLTLGMLAVTLACRAALPLMPDTLAPILYAPAAVLASCFGGIAGGLLVLLAAGIDAMRLAGRGLNPPLAMAPGLTVLLLLAATGLLLGRAGRALLARGDAQEKELALMREEVGAEMKRQELLQHELTHRVKNNFQLVGSLLRLQARKAGNDIASRILNMTVLRIQGMSALQESLYRNRDIGHVELSRYIRELCGRLGEAQIDGADIRIVVEAESIELPGEYALPLGLAISELVSNALRHAFPAGRAGVVRVILRRDGDEIILAVSDDGQGIENRDTVLNRGFGMLLVSSCAQQLEGELAVAEHPTCFEIRFPATLSH
ncbi:sensor histidine kinase [Roseomonas marmotae]|uniref:histidine kinase n=1 Tax=Roseomonas marmotae TaxID=2768161 RepID=A0ABS3K8V7_9PROT|nr:sensor histidine kinase [Roseomonas marmotae]MBO1073898.1 sensor histidine kinase [Roseomonas marmotae]QTI78484.1 sensor histidine kinase [Roseomonas marmotae]